MSQGPDLAPVKPYPGFSAGGSAQATPARQMPVVAPAEPAKWTGSLELRFPVMIDGALLSEITFRRLTGEDIADLLLEDDDGESLTLRARGLASGLHWSVPGQLAADDAEAFAEAVRPFLPASLVAVEAQFAEDMAEATT